MRPVYMFQVQLVKLAGLLKNFDSFVIIDWVDPKATWKERRWIGFPGGEATMGQIKGIGEKDKKF